MHQKQPTRRREAPAPAAAVPPGHYAAAGQPFFRPPPPSDSDPPGAGHHRAPPPDRPSPRPPGHRYAAPAERPLPRPPGSSADRPLPRPPGSPDHPALTTPPPPPGPHAYPAGEPPLRRSSSSALASCLAATAFLLLSAGGAGAALFLLFRPRPPDIAVAAVRLPSFAAANGTVAFTFQQTASVRNPNRSPLAHFDSSLRVAYAGGELGSVYIPAGLIDGGRTKDMSATFDVPAIPVADQPQQPQQMVIEVESLLVIKGRVKMLRLLTHRVQAAKVCRVGVSPVDGRVLGFRC
ncbi:hypothetical protein PAHAL_5G535500 [Panicum hallii]|uniref:Uncharacterized protein n=1 Tax=Panicum hallii TaxID=206008 RepID=A0A2T8IPF9_9POAL|nr:histone-lysine N-methyltransferase SETD1B-like [Panicum hallii]PVH39555.1 hypothetical protein PAHAL_5G535500 [Panicum hallii]